MTHDEAFAAFRERKRATEAATVKVTWRRARWGIGETGYSGLGPGGQLVWVGEARPATEEEYGHGWSFAELHPYGRVVDGFRVEEGTSYTVAKAKQAAEKLLS